MKKTILVTGCTGGIGRAICDLMSQKNWQVIGIDIKEPNYELPSFRYIQTDISQLKNLDMVFQSIREKEGALHALVNNAALQICKPFPKMLEEDWDQVMNVNLKAPYFMIQKFYPLLQEEKGSVVNISSVHAIATSANISGYSISKSALAGLTRSLAIECAEAGIRVNSILPGAVDTSMLREGLKRGHLDGSDEESLIRALGLKHLIQRVGAPSEIAQTVLFLADRERSSFITGQSIVVDGGATIKLSTE